MPRCCSPSPSTHDRHASQPIPQPRWRAYRTFISVHRGQTVTGPPILVGVDGSDCSLVAVDLAIREAALRGRSVRIVYCDPWADHPAWAHNDPAGELTGASCPTRSLPCSDHTREAGDRRCGPDRCGRLAGQPRRHRFRIPRGRASQG
ncbi:universal stress protein [Micromonospora zamorensis]|uniref:universal stress protein n=1 Tax=Micromonospora zamorensis TaxID=709883 RepID=UPI003CF742DC